MNKFDGIYNLKNSNAVNVNMGISWHTDFNKNSSFSYNLFNSLLTIHLRTSILNSNFTEKKRNLSVYFSLERPVGFVMIIRYLHFPPPFFIMPPLWYNILLLFKFYILLFLSSIVLGDDLTHIDKTAS